MAKAEMYRNRKGKRRVWLTLTGKEARWLYTVAYAERGIGKNAPDWTVFATLSDLMEFESRFPRSRDMIEIPEVRWFDPEAGR